MDHFEGIANFRDVGKTINGFLHKKCMTEGLLFRSAKPDDATISDLMSLRSDHYIETIIDLRTNTEHAKRAEMSRKECQNNIASRTDPISRETFKIPGMRYLEINIIGKGFERNLVWQLGWWSFIKVLFLVLFSRRSAVIPIIAREVIQPSGLIGLGVDTLNFCGSEVAETMRAFADPGNGPTLVHCTQGKDRTGLLVLLLVLLVLESPNEGSGTKYPVRSAKRYLDYANDMNTDEVTRTYRRQVAKRHRTEMLDAINYDYQLSIPGLTGEYENRMREVKAMGLNEDFAGCHEEFVEKIVKHLDDKYGGLEGYLHSIGLDHACINILRSRFSA